MKKKTPPVEVVRMIRFAAILWIAYLIGFAIINQLVTHRQVAPLYYILNGSIALLCLGLAYWRWIQEKLRQAFLPVIIAIITVMPVINNWITMRLLRPPGTPGPPQLPPEGPTLGMLPFLLVALLLVAWQYRWQYILLVILAITCLNFGIIWSFTQPGTVPFQGELNSALIQTIVFLTVSLAISYLMSRLKEHQQSLEKANTRLTHYASTLEHLATSRERNRLARELHDTLAHTLSGLSVQLETVKAYWDIDPNTARSMLDKSLAAAHSGLEETRRALKALRASPLDDLGLSEAMVTMVKGTTAGSKLTLDLSMTDKMPALSPDVEQCFYRIAQEAVSNVINHASANNLSVELDYIDGKVTLIIHDDGIGFDPEKSINASHFGLVGMRERAQLIGGELGITSKRGQGTTVQLTVNQEALP